VNCIKQGVRDDIEVVAVDDLFVDAKYMASFGELVTSSMHYCSSGRGISCLGSLQMTNDSGSDRNILWASLLFTTSPSNDTCLYSFLKGVA